MGPDRRNDRRADVQPAVYEIVDMVTMAPLHVRSLDRVRASSGLEACIHGICGVHRDDMSST